MIDLRVSNGLDSDHGRRSVGPDLSQNCLQKVVSRRKKSAQAKNEVTLCMVLLTAKTLKKLRTSKGYY